MKNLSSTYEQDKTMMNKVACAQVLANSRVVGKFPRDFKYTVKGRVVDYLLPVSMNRGVYLQNVDILSLLSLLPSSKLYFFP